MTCVSSELIVGVMRNRYPGFDFLLHFGSSLEGDMQERSDVDVIVVFDRPVQGLHEKFMHGGFLFDVHVFDIESLNARVHLARRGSSSVMASIVRRAAVLPESNKRAVALQLAAERVLALAPVAQDLEDIRQYITGLIDDIDGVLDSNVGIMIAIELYQSISGTVLQLNGAAGFRKRHAARAFAEWDMGFLCRLNNSLRAAVCGSFDELIACAKLMLEKIGGERREGYRSMVPDVGRMPLPVV